MTFLRRRILLLLATALLSLSHATADELDELAMALRKGGEALATSAAAEKSRDNPQQQRLAETLGQLTAFDQALIRGNLPDAQAVAGRLEIDPNLPSPLRETAGRLRRELPGFIEARDDAFVGNVEKLVEKTRTQCLVAKKEAELQPLLREVSLLDQGKPLSRTPYLERAARKLKAVVLLLPTWMEYLAAKDAGNVVRLEAVFQQLARDNNAGNYPIISDAEIRRRVDEFKPPLASLTSAELSTQFQARLAGARTLRDIPALATELAALPRFPEALYLAQRQQESLQTWFAGFAAATASLSSGELDDAWKRATSLHRIESEPWAPEAIRLRALLISELVAKSLPLSAARARRPDETTADHLLRIAREAARAQRWEEVERIQQLYRGSMGRVFFDSIPRWWSDPSELVSDYLAGQRLEAAGDAAGAVAAYLRVLRGSGELVPTAEAQERLRALLAAQKTTLPEVRSQLDATRLATVLQNLDTTIAGLKKRVEAAERAAQTRPGFAPPTAAPGAETGRLEARLKKLETSVEKLGAAAGQPEGILLRLSKLETLLAPALEAVPGGAAEPKVRLWLGPDFTVYRSAVPPALDARLGWVVRFNGKTVLTRNAKREMQFNYDGRKPGIYMIYLTGGGGEDPTSNVIDYTLTEEAAKKLGPRIIDDDWDRDGARNSPAPREQ